MGNFRLELSVVNIWDLIEECVREFRLQAKKKGVKLYLDFSAIQHRDSIDELSHVVDLTRSGHELRANLSQEIRTRKVVGAKVRISQVIRNLLSNGLKVRPLLYRQSWFLRSHVGLTTNGSLPFGTLFYPSSVHERWRCACFPTDQSPSACKAIHFLTPTPSFVLFQQVASLYGQAG